MFEALFILTTVDAGTRVARFMLSDGLANLGGPLKKLRNPSWRVGAWACSIIVVAAWGSILLMGVTDPLGGINTLFPLFGIANQLLAAIALTVVTVVIIKRGLLKWAWIPGVPLMWDLVVTMTASFQKIFSGDPKVGYWTQHFQYRDAKDAGKTAFGAAKNADQLDAVIRNTFIQGTLSVIFAVLVCIVFAAGVIVALRAIRGGNVTLSEDEPTPSRIFAPSSMIPTATEKEVQKQWDALPVKHGGRTPNQLVLGLIDGRQPLPALRRAPPPHSSRRDGDVGARLLAHAPRRHGAQSAESLLLTFPAVLGQLVADR